jgi:hypothetical protein
MNDFCYRLSLVAVLFFLFPYISFSSPLQENHVTDQKDKLLDGRTEIEMKYRKLVMNALGKKYVNQMAFRYVKNNPNLPNVLLYGDSVSIGYTEHVQESLRGVANVYRIHTNGRSSSDCIKNIKTLETAMRNDKTEGYWRFKWN